MSDCEILQDRALEDGPQAATTTPALREHLAQCPKCQAFLADLQQLTGALEALPSVDAPDALVDETLRRVKASPSHKLAPGRRWWRSGYWLTAAASFVVVGFVYLVSMPAYQVYTPASVESDRLARQWEEAQALSQELGNLQDDRSFATGEDQLAFEFFSRFGNLDRDVAGPDEKQRVKRRLSAREEQKLDELTSGLAGAGTLVDERSNLELRSYKENTGRFDDNSARQPRPARKPASLAPVIETPMSEAEPSFYRKRETADAPEAAAALATEPVARQQPAPSEGARVANEEHRPDTDGSGQRSAARKSTVAGKSGDSLGDREADNQRALPIAKADFFLADLENVQGLRFQEPRGYWRNTYVPGDSTLRLLRTRMRLWNRLPELHETRLGTVRANRQLLDVPENSAMGLYLQADKAAVSGVSRVRLQIGLQGAERKGVRPTMNVGLLLDLSGSEHKPSAQEVRAIVTALASSHQPGDRFSLSVAGPDGGLFVGADDFRHGPLQVALTRLFGDEAPADARAVNLEEALAVAAESVRLSDDPSAAFGSSAVLLVTGGIAKDQLAPLQEIAHRNAIGGIAMSVIDTQADDALGAGTIRLEHLVAAGQGQRRALADVDDATRVIEAELHAASRAVARAARLRIRLGAGVQLIDVLGSQRLDEPQAQRVREAEQSIDQRVSRNLGIQADRGEDEDGIQIVIPNFHAGDSHVILLDVLVEGPGPVADVTLRYKDLVHLKNGVARGELRLPAGERAPGPLQRNVLKNRVAFELAQAARTASGYLAHDDTARAIRTLQSMHELLIGLRETVGGWSSDRELLADADAIAGHIAYLQNQTQEFPFIRRYAVDSLQYMALRKLTTADEETQ